MIPIEPHKPSRFSVIANDGLGTNVIELQYITHNIGGVVLPIQTPYANTPCFA